MVDFAGGKRWVSTASPGLHVTQKRGSGPPGWALPAGSCLLGERVPSEGASVSGVYHPLLAVGGTAPETQSSVEGPGL